jgi:hypothetical protein
MLEAGEWGILTAEEREIFNRGVAYVEERDAEHKRRMTDLDRDEKLTTTFYMALAALVFATLAYIR